MPRLDEIHHSIWAATRWFPDQIHTTGVIADDEVVGMHYCPAQHRHSHHRVVNAWAISNFRDPTKEPSECLWSPPPPTAGVPNKGGKDLSIPGRRWNRRGILWTMCAFEIASSWVNERSCYVWWLIRNPIGSHMRSLTLILNGSCSMSL
jgi:hypothetical protein